MSAVFEVGGHIPSAPGGLVFGTGGGGTVATPTFSPGAGTYSGTQTITLLCSTPSSSIYFTTDGSTPTFPITGSTALYTGVITVSASETIKAIGTASGFSNSAVGSAAYVISGGMVFNFFISTTGSDSNSGTSTSSPWAITAINTKQSTYAGQNVGIMPGTYDVSVTMQNCNVQEAILQIKGGPNSSTRTYIGTCNSSGQYQQGTAILDCFGTVGQYGGGNITSFPYPIGQTEGGGNAGPQPSNVGNWILDGLVVSGFSRWGICVNDSGGGLPQVPNVTIQNCTLHNSRNPTTNTHPGPIIIYRATNTLVTNCWLYDNNSTAADGNHYAGILIFGITGPTSGIIIEKCTLNNSSTIYSAEDNNAVDNVTIRQCYMDMTLAGTNFNQPYAIQGAGKAQSGLTACQFHNNIVKGGNFYDMSGTLPTENGIVFYNNTWDLDGGTGYGSSDAGLFRGVESVGSTALFTVYNNLVYDNGASTLGQLGYIASNTDGFALIDYNIYGTIASKYFTYGANGGGEIGSVSFSTWKTTVGGESHSITNATNPFTNVGVNALAYTIVSGSPAFGAGRVGGLSSGGVVNAGAWDGVVTQIGCSFADGRST
jgi:hypothetical protein